MATRKETPQSELKTLTKLSYRTIMRYLRKLEKGKYVELVRTEPNEKGGKQRKIYRLTLEGLMLSFCQKEEPNLKKVVNANGHMLLAFRKFPLFQKAGIEDYFLLGVERTIENYWKRFFDYESYGLTLEWEKEDFFREFIDSAILCVPFTIRKPNPDTWETMRIKFVRICKGDRELSEFIGKQLEGFEKRLFATVERMKEWKRLET